MKFFKRDIQNTRNIIKEIFGKKQCNNDILQKHRILDIFEISLLQKSSTNFLSILK